MSDGDMADRIATLEQLSRLTVTYRHHAGEAIYTFVFNGRTVKETFSYPKAKLFAEGIDFAERRLAGVLS